MPCYPVNLEISERHCLVIGGGSVAERKVISLLDAGAIVTVISPTLTDKLKELANRHSIIYKAKSYEQGDSTGFFIVICATNNKEVNKQAGIEANLAGSLVNIIDDPTFGNFSVPAKVCRGDVVITVSTNGKSPALARRLREELSEYYGVEYGLYLELIAKAREQIKQCLPNSKEREAFWRQTLDKEVLKLLRLGKIKEAEAKINNAIGCSGTQS